MRGIDIAYRLGDITQFEADALITPINSKGIWASGVDMAINRVAGDQYHQQAMKFRREIGLGEKNAIFAKGTTKHEGKFKSVIFVIDDLVLPLNEIILKGLRFAKYGGFQNVTMPLMRTGVMAGVVEPDIQAVIKQMDIAFGTFAEEATMSITVVIYDEDTYKLFTKEKMGLYLG